MSSNDGTAIYIILEGMDPKNLRFVVAYREFQQACTFCRTALAQLANKLPVQHTIQQHMRHHGHLLELIRNSDGKCVAAYVIQKTTLI